MNYDKYGQIYATADELANLLYTQPDLKLQNVQVTDPEQYNQSVKSFYVDFPLLTTYKESNISLKEFDKRNQDNWFMPDEYRSMDIEGFLVNACPKENYDRLITELQAYRKNNMMDLLKYCKYLVDNLRKNNIVWGVGRGSSVASYVLFLIGIHKIDSIKYQLDFKEFLK